MSLTKKQEKNSLVLINEEGKDDDDYKYYKKICDYLIIVPFPYYFFEYNKESLIGKNRWRWMFDINPLYGDWHTSFYKKQYDKYGYKYSSYKSSDDLDPNIIEGLKLLKIELTTIDEKIINECKKLFRKLILENHPDRCKSEQKEEKTKIIVCISTAMEYLRNKYEF